MGHRANYLILSTGKSQLFDSHWGANRVDRDFFWGPEVALDFVRQQRPTEAWTNDVWCEGGAVLDYDAHELLIFGGEDVLFDIYQRAIWLRLMSPLWPGWTIRWAARGILDLVAKVDLPPEEVLARKPPGFKAPELRPTTLEKSSCFTLVTIVGEDQPYTLHNQSEPVLLAGPDLLPRFKRLNSPPFIDAIPPSAGLEIDPQGRSLRYWHSHGRCTLQENMESRWPGWQVVREDAWAFHHLAVLKDIYKPNPDALLDQVVEMLLSAPSSPVVGVKSFFEERRALGYDVEVNPHALVDRVSDLDCETRKVLLDLALEHYRQQPAFEWDG